MTNHKAKIMFIEGKPAPSSWVNNNFTTSRGLGKFKHMFSKGEKSAKYQNTGTIKVKIILLFITYD